MFNFVHLHQHSPFMIISYKVLSDVSVFLSHRHTRLLMQPFSTLHTPLNNRLPVPPLPFRVPSYLGALCTFASSFSIILAVIFSVFVFMCNLPAPLGLYFRIYFFFLLRDCSFLFSLLFPIFFFIVSYSLSFKY